MLREWQNHAEFQDQLRQGVIFWSVAAPERLRFYAPILYLLERRSTGTAALLRPNTVPGVSTES